MENSLIQLARELSEERERTITLRREIKRLLADRSALLSCVRYYANPEQWVEMIDPRGYHHLRFRWGDDGGKRAVETLKEIRTEELLHVDGTAG